MAVLIIGMLVIVAETVATAVQLYNDSGADYSQAKMAFYYISYHIIIFIVMIIGLFVVFILSFIVVVFRRKFKQSAVFFKIHKLLIFILSLDCFLLTFVIMLYLHSSSSWCILQRS